MYTLRTRFKKEIVCEFLPPARATKKQRVIIFCDGMPGLPGKKALMEFFSNKNYWVFHPRYRGAWESDGIFLEKSPHLDILDVIDGLPKGFASFWDNKKFSVTPDEIILIGSSFGGPAMLLASKDPRVDKVIAFSPVTDWLAPSKAEPLDWLYTFMKQAFGNGYRCGKSQWNKLKTGKFYNPAYEMDGYVGSKLLIFHTKDDESVRSKEVEQFAKKIGADFRLYAKGGHLGSSSILKPKFWRICEKFLKQ